MLLERLTTRMLALGAEPKKMFGGTCFMKNGNLVIGTHKQTGLIVRVGPEATARALDMGARQMEMGGREMKGWVFVDDAEEVAPWIDLAMAFNATLPPDAAKSKRKKG